MTHDPHINFVQTGSDPERYEVADDGSREAMEDVLEAALKRAGLPSLTELREELVDD